MAVIWAQSLKVTPALSVGSLVPGGILMTVRLHTTTRGSSTGASFLYFSIPGQKGLDLLRAVGRTTRKRTLTTREGQYKENTCVQHSRRPAIQGTVTALDLHLTSEKFV